jgi:hypothetical protein
MHTLWAAQIHVAWIRDLRPLGVLLARGGVRMIAVDVASRGPWWSQESARIRRLAPAARVIIVRDDDTIDGPDTIVWPRDLEEVLRLIAPPDPAA